MILLVDFDQTLFDTESFYDILPAPIQQFQEVYTPLDIYEEAFEGGVYSEDAQAVGEYSLEAMAEDLQNQGVNVTADEIRAAFDHAPDFLYEPETLEYLEELKDEYDIDEVIAVTRAPNEAWGQQKIRSSGINEFVDEFMVLTEPLEEETKTGFLSDRIANGEEVFLVDDLPEEIKEADVKGFLFDAEEDSLVDALRAMKDDGGGEDEPADFV